MNAPENELKRLIQDDKCEEEESVRVGMLLSFAIGILNASTYVSRGKVFASTQSGNLLYLGMDLAKGDFSQVTKYLFPPLMFAIGIIIAEHFHDKPNYKNWRKIPFIIEIALIVAATFLPISWSALANPIFGLACGLQSITFRRVRHTPVSTVVITGSYYNAVENLTRWFHLHDKEDIFRAWLYMVIVLSFFGGIVLGAWLCQSIGQYTSLVAAAALCICPFILTVPNTRACAIAAQDAKSDN